MKRIASVCAILEDPQNSQKQFNELISNYHHLVKGRLGIPFEDGKTAAISVILAGTMDEINALTGKLGKIPNIQIKTAISKKEL